MNNKIFISSVIIAGVLALSPVSNADGNSLVQMNIRKTASDAVDFTLVTSDNYNGNVVITKKSDNKYVLIMPNTSGNARVPALSGVKDLIQNIDIKTVTEGGYTKITVITTKPLNIKAHAQKSAAPTAEQLAYKQVINKSQTHTNAPVTQQKTATAATKVIVSKPETPKIETKKAEVPKTTTKKEEAKPNILTKITENKKVETAKKPKTVETAKPVAQQVAEEKPLEEVKDVVPVFEPKEATQKTAVNNIEEAAKKEIPHQKSPTIPAGVFITILSIFGIGLLIRVIKDSIEKSRDLKASFISNIKPKPQPVSYKEIINDKGLNWQERYKKYLDKSKEISKTPAKAKPYSFIETQADSVQIEHSLELKENVTASEAFNAPTSDEPVLPIQEAPVIDETKIEEKRVELERIMEKHEKTEIVQNQQKEPEPEPTKVEIEVKNEAVTIPEQLTNSVNLKAFKNPVSLEETHRDRIQTKLKRFEIVEDLDKRKNAEAKDNVVLGDSLLHTNPRNFPNAPLKVSELMEKGNRILNETQMHRKMIQDPQDYVMSSVDEYFALLDEEKTDMIPNLAPEKLDFSPKKSQKQTVNVSSEMSNPFARKQTASQPQSINGLIVKAGYEIDENRGFYLVSLDNTTALIGRAGEEISVIKRFERNVDDLKVIEEQENVYMVKAGGFRSLVEADNHKIGVLLEL